MSYSVTIESISDQLRAKDQKLAEVIDIVGPCTLGSRSPRL